MPLWDVCKGRHLSKYKCRAPRNCWLIDVMNIHRSTKIPLKDVQDILMVVFSLCREDRKRGVEEEEEPKAKKSKKARR